jgi:hypothetical protein
MFNMKRAKILAYLVLAEIFLSARKVFAEGLVSCGGPGQAACTICHFFALTQQVLYYILTFAGSIAALIFICCGLNMIVNRGNVRAISTSKTIMLVATIGLLIIFTGWVGINTYFISAGAAEWDGYSLTRDWWKISVKCGLVEQERTFCGDGIVQRGTESCDPKETIENCQARSGYTQKTCDEVIVNCDPTKCMSRFCGDGIIQSGEECDPQMNVKDCVKNGGKTMAECEKSVDLCASDCKLRKEEEAKEKEEKKEEDSNDPYVAGRCLDSVSGAHSPDCPALHSGLDGYTLLIKNYYVAPGSYHDSALSPITATGPNGEKICMCFDTCAYAEKFKYVLVDKNKRLFDVYATPEGKMLYQTRGEEGAFMDDTKPVVYLYPKKTTDIFVKVTPKGKMTASIPDYGSGWNVSVEPSGMIDNFYGYLFYETEISASEVSVPFQGFLVDYEGLGEFFDRILPAVGLQGKESADFKEWWLNGRLKPAKYYLVRLLDEKTIDDIEPMTISPKPDTLIRIRFVFTPLDEKIETVEPSIETPQRQGFTAVEWGGLIEK